ncbi:MAG: YmdB family metallophosphoesterase [Ruminococcaceae bacterium]|nr:YmdB family metallophosphoesterase [Oscillospiraceae bacterium]
MKILAIGDVVGRVAVEHLSKKLYGVRAQLGADFVIANGENASEIHGVSASDAEGILSAGVDFITLGNHAFRCRDIGALLDGSPDKIIRPANYPAECPGVGYSIIRACGVRMLIINIMGTVFLDALDNPFFTVDRILEREAENYDISVMDIHAEATSEKYALARYFDGRINIIFGTHTHVQTADEQILPRGTAYITDIGMTGPCGGILGTDAEAVIYKMRTHMPARFKVAEGEVKASAVLFELEDNAPYRAISVKRIRF